MSAETVAANGKTAAGKRTVGLESQARYWPTARASWNENRTTKPAPSHGATHGKLLAGEAVRFQSTLLDPAIPEDGTVCLNVGPTSLRLNPRFVEWLMGFPVGWTEAGAAGTAYTHWETQASRWLRRLRSSISMSDSSAQAA